MDDGLKQRIIGAIVLLALAVIFIPVIFDRERIEPVDKRTQIPIAPHVETVEISAPKKLKTVEPVISSQEVFAPDESKPVEAVVIKKEEKPALNKQGTPDSWVIQVASFLHEKHANDLRDKLVKDGFAAYTRQVATQKNGKRVRVFVGPKISKKRIVAEKEKIEKQYKVKTLLLKFEP